MKILSLIKYSLIGVLFISSCTKLDEKDVLFDTATSRNFGQTDAEIVSLLAAAYTNLYGSFGGDGSIMRLEEVPTDEIVVPQRGPDWGDGGHWIRLKLHTTRPDDGGPEIPGRFLFRGVNTCNRVLIDPGTFRHSFFYEIYIRAKSVKGNLLLLAGGFIWQCTYQH